jgi:hypothetical protein
MESKPVFELHKLPKGFIVTSDEEILPNTLYMNNGVLFTSDSVYDEGNNPNNSNPKVTNHNFKVIAQQDQIDFSSLSEEQQKEIGWFDVEKLAEQFVVSKVKMSSQAAGVLVGFIEGFQKAQELLSDRDVSHNILNHLCDKMDSISQEQIDKDSFQLGRYRTFKYVFDYIQSLSQKSWKVEIEHTCNGIRKEGESCTLNNKCTYPNCGKIKILKLC